jgi:hypothetical protein
MKQILNSSTTIKENIHLSGKRIAKNLAAATATSFA